MALLFGRPYRAKFCLWPKPGALPRASFGRAVGASKTTSEQDARIDLATISGNLKCQALKARSKLARGNAPGLCDVGLELPTLIFTSPIQRLINPPYELHVADIGRRRFGLRDDTF
jgi:hypothetical protein